jgi:hypothetical protein
MPTQPVNSQLTEEVRAPRKRQAPFNDNGEAVTMPPAPKRRKSAGSTTKTKAIAKPKPPPKKTSATKAVPAKATPPKRKPSVEIEDVVDKDNTISSQQPQNPRNNLEAADGSDDDDEYSVPPPAAMSVDGDEGEEEVEIVELAGEDDEAELGQYHI